MAVTDIYDERYADVYRALYIDHPMWKGKHQMNLEILASLLSPGCSWLDTCCGQAWHFAQVGPVVRQTGIDISAAQLCRARMGCPHATFIQGDVLEADLGPGQFDVVTNFWGAYSYLDAPERIAAFVQRLVTWTAPKGAVYLELITPATLLAFNLADFAHDTGARTILRSDDGVRWSYQDPGGRHELTSPLASFFLRLLEPHFEHVEIVDTVVTMQQLVAVRRRSP